MFCNLGIIWVYIFKCLQTVSQTHTDSQRHFNVFVSSLGDFIANWHWHLSSLINMVSLMNFYKKKPNLYHFIIINLFINWCADISNNLKFFSVFNCIMGYDMLYIDILTFFRDYSFRFEKLNQASFFICVGKIAICVTISHLEKS